MNYNRQTSRVFSPAPPSQFSVTRARRGLGCRCNSKEFPSSQRRARDDTARVVEVRVKVKDGIARCRTRATARGRVARRRRRRRRRRPTPRDDPAESSLEGVDDEARDRRDARRRRRAHRWPDDVPQRRERVVDVAVVVVGGLRGAVERGAPRTTRRTSSTRVPSRSSVRRRSPARPWSSRACAADGRVVVCRRGASSIRDRRTADRHTTTRARATLDATRLDSTASRLDSRCFRRAASTTGA